MSEIKNGYIEGVSLTMSDHGCLTFYLSVSGGCWGFNYGGYCLGKGYLGADKFSGSAKGMECLMHIMNTIGVERWEDLKGKYIRVVDPGWGGTVTKIGNIIDDKWFDIKEFYATDNT